MSGALALNTTITAVANCPAGKLLLGGGGSAITNLNPSRFALQSSRPTSTTQWQAIGVIVTQATTAGSTSTVTAFAVCTA
jgi:hypothetical protein